MREHQIVADFWTGRLAAGAAITGEQRAVFRETVLDRLSRLHPAYLAVIPTGGRERPCPVLKAALQAARLAPMQLQLGVEVRIRPGAVMQTIGGVTAPIWQAERTPARGHWYAGAVS